MYPEKKQLRKDLQSKLTGLIDTFVKSTTTAETKKIRKAVKEASKIVAKAVSKSQEQKNVHTSVKKEVQTVSKINPIAIGSKPQILAKNHSHHQKNVVHTVPVAKLPASTPKPKIVQKPVSKSSQKPGTLKSDERITKEKNL